MKPKNTYTITMLCVSVHPIQLWNLVTEFNEIWYTHNFTGGRPNTNTPLNFQQSVIKHSSCIQKHRHPLHCVLQWSM